MSNGCRPGLPDLPPTALPIITDPLHDTCMFQQRGLALLKSTRSSRVGKLSPHCLQLAQIRSRGKPLHQLFGDVVTAPFRRRERERRWKRSVAAQLSQPICQAYSPMAAICPFFLLFSRFRDHAGLLQVTGKHSRSLTLNLILFLLYRFVTSPRQGGSTVYGTALVRPLTTSFLTLRWINRGGQTRMEGTGGAPRLATVPIRLADGASGTSTMVSAFLMFLPFDQDRSRRGWSFRWKRMPSMRYCHTAVTLNHRRLPRLLVIAGDGFRAGEG